MSGDITVLLKKYQYGDANALEDITRLLYPELKNLARRRAQNADIGATTLIQETFARYLAGDATDSASRNEFFGLMATIMRRVIVDEIRHSAAQKRQAEFTINQNPIDKSQPSAEFLLSLDQALNQLNEHNPQLRLTFECRYFAGYSTAETANVLNVSQRTAERHWREAREWIADQLQ